MRLTNYSVCSGIGASDLAAEWAGFDHIGMCEIDPFCQLILRKNFPGVPIDDDLRTVDLRGLRGSVAVLSAGIPCQPYSCSGLKKGKADPRDLWPALRRVVKQVQPPFLLIENVANFARMGDGLDRVLSDLDRDDFEAITFMLPAAAVGAWHKRERVIVLAANPHYKSRAEQWEVQRQKADLETHQNPGSTDGGSHADADGGGWRSGRGSVPARRDATQGRLMGFDDADASGLRGGGSNLPADSIPGSGGARALSSGGAQRTPDAHTGGPGLEGERVRGSVAGQIDADANILRLGGDFGGESGVVAAERSEPPGAYTDCSRLLGLGDGNDGRISNRSYESMRATHWSTWEHQPLLGGDLHGAAPGLDVPTRRARVKALGNSNPPQLYYPFWKALAVLCGS